MSFPRYAATIILAPDITNRKQVWAAMESDSPWRYVKGVSERNVVSKMRAVLRGELKPTGTYIYPKYGFDLETLEQERIISF